jgi:hypothetical protein
VRRKHWFWRGGDTIVGAVADMRAALHLFDKALAAADARLATDQA